MNQHRGVGRNALFTSGESQLLRRGCLHRDILLIDTHHLGHHPLHLGNKRLQFRPFSADGGIYVANPKGEQVGIYTADGKLMHSSSAIECDVKLASGIYIVKVGAFTEKVLVK